MERAVLGRRLIQHRDVPDVEIDGPERQREQRVRQVSYPPEPAVGEQRLKERPGQAEDDQQGAQIAHQQVLDHVDEDELVVDPAER